MKDTFITSFCTISGIIALLFTNCSVDAQKLDVAYVPTPEFVVERMLDMANVGPGDYVVDLGCGDGRIVIAAALRGAAGHGVDIDPNRVMEARENAQKAGVADRVVFKEQNIYETDFSRANVITMYLFPSINVKLRPVFLEKLEPGSRIVSHDFGMDEWKPDMQYGRMENHAVYVWIVPAKVEGSWNWDLNGKEFRMNIIQEFQKISIRLLSGETSFTVDNPFLSGQRISFSATGNSGQKLVFSGKVKNDEIKGIVQIHKGVTKSVENWSAARE